MNYSAPTSTTNTSVTKNLGAEKRHWLNVFRRVITLYDDYKATGNAPNTGHSDGIITMSPSDFICDVEVAAGRVLTGPELSFFNFVYKAKDQNFIDNLVQQIGQTRYNSVKKRVQLKVGRILEARGVFPTAEYFRPVDCR